jgi:thioredoxin 1
MTNTRIIGMIAITLAGGALGGLTGYFGKCTNGTCPLTSTPLRGAFIGLMIGALTAVTFANQPVASHADTDSQGESAVLHIANQEEFTDKVLGDDTLALVDFYADWCGPCRKLSPIVESIAADGKDEGLLVAKVNIDRHGDIAAQYKVRRIPHLVLIRDGTVIARTEGYQTESDLAAWIAKYRGME